MQFGGCLNFIATLIVLAASLLVVANVETTFTQTAPIVVESLDTAEVYASVPSYRRYRALDDLTPDALVLGSESAPIAIVVFTDFFCPACQQYKTSTLDDLVVNYVITGQAALEIRFLPTAASPYSEFTAHVAECAADYTGEFGLVFHTLFEIASDQSIPDAMILQELIARLNIDPGSLDLCLNAPPPAQHDRDSQLAAALEITGAPSVRYTLDDIFDWAVIPGGSPVGPVPYELLAGIIEAANAP
jgi:protein-disulfide isomerase